MTRKLITWALALCLTLPITARTPADPVLRELDRVLAQASTYEGYFQQRADVLRQMLAGKNTPEQEYEIRKKLASEFSSYSMDSTVVQLSRNRALARQLGDAYRQAETDFALAREYALAGYHSDALDILSDYRLEAIPPGLEYTFFEVSSYLYGELAAYSSNNAQYWQKKDMYRVSMLPFMEEGTYEWYDQQRVQAESDRDREKALEYALKALEVTEPNSRQYARAAFFVSTYQDDPDDQIAWLARSAIADVMCATKDYASLNDLAHKLYDQGDIERAFKYAADHCMPDALFFGGKLRPWQIAQFFPALEKAYAARINRNTRQMWLLFGLAGLLLLALGALLFYLSRRQRVLVRTRKALEEEKARVDRRNQTLQDVNEQLQALNGELQESSKVRQEYIALYLQNLSENISTSRQYKNHVLKYIRRGNDKYLIEEIEALPPIEDDIREFYQMFDRTFINLYPDFVDEFNALLADGEAIVSKGDDILTPELRVFALIKLGITESSKIATLLHYSANTVYNYRAKIKNKARGDRELFEAAVQAIE
ncbi:MAG: hypothetical protein J6P75_11490 [Bacteroidales bacterium]|nr:hypothetical protein [Bacteroidales bacterium]